MELSSVYVGVEDMDRAVAFYRELFGEDPEQEEERFSTFSFEGIDFGLYDAGYDGYKFEYGDNCVPNFEVDDVAAARKRIDAMQAKMVHDGILEFDDYRTFQFVDPEGNVIEIFSIDSE